MAGEYQIQADTWGPLPWHRARLELLYFMLYNGDSMSEEDVEYARWLYGSEYQCRHHSPPWSKGAPEYVHQIYNWINERRREIAARRMAA